MERSFSFSINALLKQHPKQAMLDRGVLQKPAFEVQCPGGHSGCTANHAYMDPHSERQMAFDVASQMHKYDIMVRTLTTDSDTKSY